jgi:hypothetical protein
MSPRFSRAKIGQNLAADVHQAENVRLKLAFDLFRSCRFERPTNGVAGVVDNRVDAPEFFERAVDRLFIESASVTSSRKHSMSAMRCSSSAFSGARIVAATRQFLT